MFYITVAKPTNSFVSPFTPRFAISVNIRRRKCKTVLSHNTLLAIELGPLHMSPVDRASQVTEISPHSYFLCKNFDVFI